jgi:predicted P-loop ATPase
MLRKAFIDRFGFDVGKYNILDAVQVLCVENTTHPVRKYLDGLEWDSASRIDTWLIDYMEAEDTPLNRAIGRLFFIAGVRRIREPGCKFDTMIVFEGVQGTGKSTILSILAGEDNFSDQNIIGLDPKTQAEALEGAWIFEIAELSGLKHTDTAYVKAFLSRSTDRVRPAYARFRESWPRQGIIVGTTNDDSYLKDDTGNRRFLPVKTGQIDLEEIKRDRDLLWAEAAEIEADGEPITLPKELWEDARKEQLARMPVDPWLDVLGSIKGTIVNGTERISSRDLLGENHINISAGQQQYYHTTRLAKIMKALGWEGPKAMKIAGKAVRGYARPADGGAKDDLPNF